MPRRIAHLFCDLDVMPSEIGKWRKQGYMVAKVIPFDMFPGTNNLEVLVVLLPDKFGLLNRKPPPKSYAENSLHENKVPQDRTSERPRSNKPFSGARSSKTRQAPEGFKPRFPKKGGAAKPPRPGNRNPKRF